MKKRKILQALKAAATYFSTAAGAVSLVIGLVALAVIVPPFVSIPIIVGIGGIFAYFGGRRKWIKLDEEQANEDLLDSERQKLKKEQDEMLTISRNLDKRMAEIAEAEQKIQVKLEECEREHKYELERQRQDTGLISPVADTSHRHKQIIEPQAALVSHEHQSSYHPKVTIKINNLPTFFTVENTAGRNVSGGVTVHAAIGQDAIASRSHHKA